MSRIKSNEKGFTLIEVIVTLVLVGITAALAGMWIVSVVNGYIFTKTNASTVQKAQLAMTRLAKEFSAIRSVTAASGTGITYKRVNSDLTTSDDITVSLDNANHKLQINGNTLTDSVSNNGFSLKYWDDIPSSGTQDSGTNWQDSRRIIEIKLKLKGANDIESEFVQRVDPRNL